MEYPRCLGWLTDVVFSLAFIPKLSFFKRQLIISVIIKAKKPNTSIQCIWFLVFLIPTTYATFLRFLGLTKVMFKKCSNESSRISNQGSGNLGDSVPVKVEL